MSAIDKICWSTQPIENKKSYIITEYVLNDIGVFSKKEKRIQKAGFFSALMGVRIGMQRQKDKNYLAAPVSRSAIKWNKITGIKTDDETLSATITGNKSDSIELLCTPENYSCVIQFIKKMQLINPIKKEPDNNAAAWLCWCEDDDWGDPYASLEDMIEKERPMSNQRLIDPEVLESTSIEK